MENIKNSRTRYFIAFALFLAGFGALLFFGLKQNSIYFLNVSEALAMPTEKMQQIRLFGTVAPEGLEYGAKSFGVRFLLADSENPDLRIPVQYLGAVPDLFKPGAEVILEGGFTTKDAGLFSAKTLMTRCPSKYESQKQSG